MRRMDAENIDSPNLISKEGGTDLSEPQLIMQPMGIRESEQSGVMFNSSKNI
jgi:hypothetical protein